MGIKHSVYVGPYVEVTSDADVYDLIGDELAGACDNVLIANHRYPRRDMHADRLDGVQKDATAAPEIEWFETRYADALAKLRAANVFVRLGWGVVGYWS